MSIPRKEIISTSLSVASNEIQNLISKLDAAEVSVLIDAILQREQSGNVLLTGIGTSGVAAQKIVHSLRCQQLPAHYLSPGDALHGASGVIQKEDLLIAISNGGDSETVNETCRIASARGAQTAAVTADRKNNLASIADIIVQVQVERESDYIGLLATSSILCVIALFDAIASVIMAERNFKPEEFAKIHPKGGVGHKLTEQKK
ncbi:MAG: SIS domain-containing protein [Sphaerochaetaceae bacterium]|nr:SIS domain-containing protein [Sphaerochaetaceae bacterium]MDC7248005.1 SIS domain-containing protein [Sphaerochaetaceae bacterium]